MLEIFKGRPADCVSRAPRETRVYDLLDRLGVEYDRVDHQPADTMEVCAQIDAAFGRTPGSEAAVEGASEGPVICKNLFLTNKQHSRHYLLMMPGDKKFLTRNLSAQINSARLSFASADEMLEMLDTLPGSASVMSLMNDADGRVQLLIDRDVLLGTHVGCHPCQNTSSLRLLTADLIDRVLPALGHSPVYVTL